MNECEAAETAQGSHDNTAMVVTRQASCLPLLVAISNEHVIRVLR